VPVATSSAVNLAGEIVYNGQKIKVDANGNMEFILGNGVKVPGVVRADGSYTFSNGTTGNLSRTPGVTSITVGGKTFPILSTIKGASDLTDEWLKMNPGVPDAWRHDGGVNNAQVAEWIRQNPNLTPEQIVAAMEKYKLLLGQVSAAMGKGNDINYIIGLANKVGITNQELSKKKIIDPLNIAKNSDNIWNAVSVGMLPQGVWYAFNYLNSGRNHPMAVYSQADFDLAKKYMQEGYWGPTGTGDMPTEMKNAGLLNKDGKYTGPNYWKTST
jgi:hypothetical protein